MLFKDILQEVFQSKWSSAANLEDLINSFFYPDYSEAAQKYTLHLDAFLKQSNRTHSHLQITPFPSFCIIYTTEGSCNLYYDERNYALVPKTLAFLDCQKGLELFRPEITQWSAYLLFFNGENANYFFDLFYRDRTAAFILPPVSALPEKMNTLFSSTQSVQNSEFAKLIIHKLLTDILVASFIEKTSNQASRKMLPNHIVNAMAYIEQNYRQPLSLDGIAEALNISKYTLSHDFTEHIGTSVMESIIQKRINDAKELLSSTEMSVNDISSEVGFSNNTHFIQTFKKRVGVTPLQYRKQHNLHSYAHILSN